MRNKYVNRSKISEAKFRQLVRYFALDLTAIQITELTGLNRNTVNRYLTEIRKKIFNHSIATSPVSGATIPSFDASKFDDFCILVREFEGKIFTDLIPQIMIHNTEETIQMELLKKTRYDLIIHPETGNQTIITGSRRESNKLHRIKINRIKSFWGNAQSRLAKFKGMHSSTYRYHIKECEFRFNNRNRDLYQLLLRILRKDPLF